MLGALAFCLAFSTVDVIGEGTCPAPSDVSRLLAEMLPATEASPGPHRRARLSRTEKAIRVELFSASGERVAERQLDLVASCDDLAGAIAVILATWQGELELDPRITARVSLRTPPPPTQPTTVAVQAAPASHGSPPPGFDLGLALLASLARGQAAPGARVGGWIAPGGWHLGLGAALSGTTARSEQVGPRPGAASWSRITLAAGPDERFNLGRTMVGAHAQALAALLRVEGVGLPTTASDSTAQLGTSVGVQIGRPWGNASPWIGADVLFWPGHDRLEISGLTAQGELPRLELQIVLGLSIGRLP